MLLGREFASAKEHVYIDYEPESNAEFPSSVTYAEIKAWIQEEYGLKVSSLYIAQVKQKHGIFERECYNKPKSEGLNVRRRKKQPLMLFDKQNTKKLYFPGMTFFCPV